MKKLLFGAIALFCLTSTTSVQAQTNMDFETWAPTTVSSSDPTGWGTVNIDLFPFFGPVSTFREVIDPGEAFSSPRMVTTTGYAPTFGVGFDTLAGVVSIGGLLTGATGIPYASRPTSLDYLFKHAVMAGDTGVIFVQLQHWNGVATIIDGQGVVTFQGASVTSWTTANLPITYFTTQTPDTLILYAASSRATANVFNLGINSPPEIPGSELEVDSFVLNLTDVGVIALDAPNSGCGLSPTESITIEIENFGLSAMDTIPVAYRINGGPIIVDTLFTSLGAGATTLFTFTQTADLSTVGIYSFDLWTGDVNDDDKTNDSLLAQVVLHLPAITAFPYLEDFEAEALCGNTIFACNPDGACVLAGNWQNAAGDDIDWSTDEDGTPSGPGTGPLVDHTVGTIAGNYLFTEASGGCSGQTANLITACPLDLTVITAPRFSFWYHMAGGVDMGNLYIDIDTGGAWITIDSIIGTQQAASGDPWLERDISLISFASAGSALLRLRGVTGPGFGSDLAIDDPMVYQPPPTDVGVLAITAPNSGCGLTASETITIQVVNFGSTSIDTVPIVYTLDGGPSVIDTIFATILPGDTATASFAATVDLSTFAAYTIDTWTQFPGDGDNSNDSLLGYIVMNTAQISTFPYSEGFETGNGSWFTNGANTSWAIGAPTGPFISAAANGTNAWVTNLSGDYNDFEVSFLLSPCLDFTSLGTDPVLTFSHIFQTEACCDEGWVEFSTNDGGTWTKLGTSASGSNWYNDAVNDWWDGNSGVAGAWRNASHTLTGLGGQDSVRIRFVFNSDLSITDDGFGVDDVSIALPPSIDVGVIATLAPLGGCGLTNEFVEIRVTNFGSASLDTIPVQYSVDGGPAVTDTIFPTLLPGDSVFFIFSAPADVSGAGPHIIDAWTLLIGDGSALNDSSLGFVVVNDSVISTFPYVEDFEAEPTCATACASP
ncbi:MAG: hypothetical protein JKX73_03500, partial [Flavobacteriales bacterium]|nr:hypothetical protein [Flavobacteriales bacterium]